MTTNKEQKKELLSLKPIDIADNEHIKEQFISTYMNIHKVDKNEAEAFYKKEKGYFNAYIKDDSLKLNICTPVSIISAFLEIAITGLSVKKQSQAEAYISKISSKVTTPTGESWINTAQFVVQAHGELSLRKRAGQILHCHNPVIVYENDSFEIATNESGDTVPIYKAEIPRTSSKIKACFVKLTLQNNVIDFKYFLPEDWQRLQGKSKKFMKNDKGNALYTSGENGQIDVGFLEAKLLKHTFKTLPKIRINSSAIFEEELPEGDDNIENENENSSFDSGENIPKAQPESPQNAQQNGSLFPENDSPF
jgi:recombinational DNA repair protein RecT